MKPFLMALAATSAVAVTAGCGTDESFANPFQTVPVVSVYLAGASVGPGIADGSEWDGLGSIDPALWNLLGEALSSVNPALGVVSFLGQPAMDAVSAPDPFGRARIAVNGTYDPSVDMALFPQQDTFQPLWTDVGWRDVPLTENIRVRVELFDEDVENHDPIGAVELDYGDLMNAMNANQITQIVVADQAANPEKPQLLLVCVSVIRQK